jgi:hypothetical protein
MANAVDEGHANDGYADNNPAIKKTRLVDHP